MFLNVDTLIIWLKWSIWGFLSDMLIVDFMSIDSETDHELFLFLDCFFRNFNPLDSNFYLNKNIYLTSPFVLEEGGAQLIFKC